MLVYILGALLLVSVVLNCLLWYSLRYLKQIFESNFIDPFEVIDDDGTATDN